MNTPQKRYSKKALACLEQMSQGNLPTRAEFAAAWNAGLIDTTEKGARLILETVYNLVKCNARHLALARKLESAVDQRLERAPDLSECVAQPGSGE